MTKLEEEKPLATNYAAQAGNVPHIAEDSAPDADTQAGLIIDEDGELGFGDELDEETRAALRRMDQVGDVIDASEEDDFGDVDHLLKGHGGPSDLEF